MDLDSSKECLEEFIECYKGHRCLWDTTCPEYVIRNVKQSAYEELVQVLRKYKKNAHILDVKRKINTLRSSYRREVKKIRRSESEISAAGEGTLYEPTLWWFDNIDFLRNPDKANQTITDKKEFIEYLEEDGEFTNTMMNEEDPIERKEVIQKPQKPTKRKSVEKSDSNIEVKTKKNESSKYDDILSMALVLAKGNDTFDHMSKAWAGKLRDMEKNQRIIAERAIGEIIFQGQLGLLTMQSVENLHLWSRPQNF